MTTAQNRTNCPTILATAALTVLTLALIAASGLRPTPATTSDAPPREAFPIAAGADLDHPLSPAATLYSGKPTLFFFYPHEVCQHRYCLQPNQVAGQVAATFGESVNLVPVITHTAPADEAAATSPTPVMENWDLWLVPPYDSWVPRAEETAFGMGLPAPTLVLVDAAGEVRYSGYGLSQAFDLLEDLEPSPQAAAGS